MDAEKIVKYTPSLHVRNIEEKIGKDQKRERIHASRYSIGRRQIYLLVVRRRHP